MPRSDLFRRLSHVMRQAAQPDAFDPDRMRLERRQLLKLGGLTAASLVAPTLTGCGIQDPEDVASANRGLKAVNADIGIVGSGIAGVACAYELMRTGTSATVYEAGDRIGGRMYSMGGAFPTNGLDWMGQSLERGGELIDTAHKTMIGYAQELKLQLEDVNKPKLETAFLFGGQRISEATMVEEMRVLVDAWRDDLRNVQEPTAASFTPFEEQLDRMSLDEWLAARGAGRNIGQLLKVAYCIEFGQETDQLGCLSFIQFAKASRKSRLLLWGTWSDERYHVIGGNQQIPVGLAARLKKPVQFGNRLLAVDKLSDGRIRLTFDRGGRTVTATHDAVVLAIPFHLLRGVQLGASLALPWWKKQAIAETVCGDNAKLMIGFAGQPWVEQGSSGQSYSDLPHLQCTWETDRSLAAPTHSILTDYTGGALARSLSPTGAQAEAESFLWNLDQVFPGSRARARRDSSGKLVCHLEAWPKNPLTKGAYTTNATGYFTRVAGYEGPAVGNLYFAGESTDSFYNWQGFMEGGATTGVRAAGEIQRDFA